MSFLTIKFLLFLTASFLAYYICPKKACWIVLLVASFVFYLSAGVQLVFYLLFAITSTYIAGILISNFNDKYAVLTKKARDVEKKKALKSKYSKYKKIVIGVVVPLNISFLIFFKWYNTVAEGLNGMLSEFLPSFTIPTFDLLLPLGISFYTFQTIGYLIDIYRNKIKPERNYAKYALFVSFFPQLIQGPISRHDELAEQLYTPHSFSFKNLKFGMQLMIWGYFKKLVIADRIAIISRELFGTDVKYAGLYIFIGTVVSAIYVYADFSGGVDIARGAAEVFGINMPQNFERPYFARSLPEYWRRWHITLNNWWRDYVYFPLTLSKPMLKLGQFCRKRFGHNFGKMVSVYIGVYIVRIINAMWHGANWIYFFSGLYFGFIITGAMMLAPLSEKIIKTFKIRTECFSWQLFQILRTFVLVCFGRVIVSTKNITVAFNSFKAMFSQMNINILFDGSLYKLGLSEKQLSILILAIIVVLVASILQEKGIVIRHALDKQNYVFQWMVTVAMILAIFIFGAYGKGYSESSFVYMKF